jgi:hypothetical protein
MQGRTISGTDAEIASSAPERQADRDAIRAQLEQILSSHLFRNSKRCNSLLRYVVSEVLEGRGEQLKERTIGISAFGRQPDYDTNEDPIVRTSAMEVRKRLAQYYHELGHETELRIDVASGSYIPEFRFLEPVTLHPGPAQQAVSTQPAVETPPDISVSIAPQSARKARNRTPLLIGGVILVTLVTAVGVLMRPQDPRKAFWTPIWRNSDTIILGAGTSLDQALHAGQPPKPGDELNSLEIFRADQVGFADAITMARVSAMLGADGKEVEIRRAASLTLDDLRKMPSVLIGAINNPWTLRLNAALRFYIERDPSTGLVQIVDRQKSSQAPWRADPTAPYSGRTEDWAVISRFSDPRTEQTVLLLAGLGRDGTTAAGEFVTQSKYLESLAKKAPAGWQRKNLQVVIGTEVINGNVGPPRIVDFHFW